MDEVVIAKGFHEASIFSLTGAGQKISPSRVVGHPVCSTSPSWLPLMTKSPNILCKVNIVVVAVVAEVDVRTEVFGEPLKLKLSVKVK